VHEHIQDICRRFAKLGYLAIAQMFAFWRCFSVEQYSRNQKGRLKVPDAQVMSDLMPPSLGQLVSSGEHQQSLGITGFCWVGGLSGCISKSWVASLRTIGG